MGTVKKITVERRPAMAIQSRDIKTSPSLQNHSKNASDGYRCRTTSVPASNTSHVQIRTAVHLGVRDSGKTSIATSSCVRLPEETFHCSVCCSRFRIEESDCWSALCEFASSVC